MGASASRHGRCGCGHKDLELPINASGGYDITFVQSLGVEAEAEVGGRGRPGGTRSVRLGQQAQRNTVLCPDGHTMKARVAREMFVMCEARKCCEECEEDITIGESRYQCKKCGWIYCNACARESMGLVNHVAREQGLPVDLMPGDLFLCGPDKYGIHHVIFATSTWIPVDPEVIEALQPDPGMQVLGCQTIESTQGSVGVETWWYPTTTFFQRDPYTGVASLLADIPPDSRTLHVAMDPVPLKILLHPFRPYGGGPELDCQALEEVVQELADASRKYGKYTAVTSVLAGMVHKEVIDPADYPTAKAQERLLQKIRKSWDRQPICASVAVKCWQKYFDITSEDDEEALQSIFEWMPHWCHLSTPSALVKNLTLHGWLLQDNLDA